MRKQIYNWVSKTMPFNTKKNEILRTDIKKKRKDVFSTFCETVKGKLSFFFVSRYKAEKDDGVLTWSVSVNHCILEVIGDCLLWDPVCVVGVNIENVPLFIDIFRAIFHSSPSSGILSFLLVSFCAEMAGNWTHHGWTIERRGGQKEIKRKKREISSSL